MMLFDTKPFFDWLIIHPFLAGIITFIIAFFECLMFIGVVVPGAVLMTALGSLIGIGVLSFWNITAWATAGAITGDLLSFWAGHHYQEYTSTFWLFRRYPKLLDKGKTFFNHHGGKSIFVGRFMGPIRAVLPFIAGMMRMPYLQFFVADTISAIAWPPVYMLPGILLGQASQYLPPEAASKLILFVILILLCIWLIYYALRTCYIGLSRLLDKQIAYLWKFARQHPRFASIASFLMDPISPQSHVQLGLTLICFISLVAFLFVAVSVMHHGIVTVFNEPIYYFMRNLHQPHLTRFFVAITEISPRVLTYFWLIVTMLFLIKRRFWTALHWFLAGVLCFGLGAVIKHFMHIVRPTGLFVTPAGASFPSGHTLSSVTLLGFFSILTALDHPKKILRVTVYSLTSLVIFLIIFSRVYLTAHWFSDVLGGTLLGISIVTGITVSYRRKKTRKHLPIGQIGIIGLIILCILWGANLFHEYKKQLYNFQLISSKVKNEKLQFWWNNAAKASPLYRLNRFGYTSAPFNLQWAGQLTTIQHQLERQGWRKLSPTKLWVTLYHLSLRQHAVKTPLFSSSHAGEKPDLTMIKYIPQLHRLIVLELWASPIQFEKKCKLWLGLVHYQKTWHLQFQPLKKKELITLISPEKVLQKDLPSKYYDFKEIIYPHLAAESLFIKPIHNHSRCATLN